MNQKIFNTTPYIFKLKSGLNVHLLPTKSHITYAQLDIPFGSYHLKYEKDNQIYDVTPGSHHFLEHKMFATPDGDGFEKLIQLGVQANALTTYSQTSYTLNGTTDVLKAIIYLVQLLESTYFTEQNVKSELKIINEEIQMYDDDPDTKIIQKLHEQLLYHHPLIHDILGTKDDIKKITKDVLLNLFESFYLSDKRQLVVMGPIDVALYEQELRSHFDVYKNTPNIKYIETYEPNMVRMKEDTLYLDVSMPSLTIGFKYVSNLDNPDLFYKTDIAMSFLMRMIYGSQSEFTEKLIQDGYITGSFDLQTVMEDRMLIFILDQTTNQPQALKDLIYKEFFDNGLNYINQESFDLIKRSYLGSYIMALDDVESSLFLYAKYKLKETDLVKSLSILESLTIDDIYGIYHVFTKEMVSSLITLPNIENNL